MHLLPIINFPDPDLSDDPDGLICVSEEIFLNPRNLIKAYYKGIFPWMIDGYEFVPWFCPPKRAILIFDELHVPRSLRKAWKRSKFTYTIDKSFAEVMRACAVVKRKGQEGTWITKKLYESFVELHQMGYAHSVEVWDENGKLVGGLYGVDAGGVFSGESMFHYETNASKLAFLFLVERLKEKGASWLDIQVMSSHFRILGAREVKREKFLQMLREAQQKGIKLFD
ncbi:MAG: leucyl/phenylalanyl-tRNA--protein transferase [Pyrinomonadaceae bacterium]|nr:leucyl/phenylalanyl-tRNA--protein transferase [Pyrinomonadaceae bacterium]MCX7640145.1 leucyl/phenylalanyl-tRNA--protein transferase [Pyrinomonadaceae bacterium]MDW8303267.1 leucyl/phenylalanyl-tRNA--protein transferase [Acidobacteriota bacterium]